MPSPSRPAPDLDAIERAAKNATPGKRSTFCRGIKQPPTGLILHMSAPGQGVQSDHDGGSMPSSDDRYHAMLDPETVLDLLSRARRCEQAEEHIASLLDGLDANGDPERCGLSLTEWDKRTTAARAFLERHATSARAAENYRWPATDHHRPRPTANDR